MQWIFLPCITGEESLLSKGPLQSRDNLAWRIHSATRIKACVGQGALNTTEKTENNKIKHPPSFKPTH